MKTINKMKTGLNTAICCIACQENDYIHEWVDYYYKLGISHIFIYDNNKSFESDEHFEDVIQDYIDSSFVTIINKRDIVQLSFQIDCYNECYRQYKDVYDWFLFIDCDEFLTLYKFDNVTDFLSQDIFSDFQVIKINWLSYNDNGNIYKTEGLVQDRFPNPSDINKNEIEWENRLLKSFVRGSLDTSLITMGIHTPIPLQSDGIMLHVNISDPNYVMQKQEKEKDFHWKYRVCFADGSESFDFCYPNCFTPGKPLYDDAVIKHYRTKSCQEYVDTKARRGFQDCAKSILNAGTYFYFNEYSPEKMDYFMSRGLEKPILLINSDTYDLGELMSLYAASRYAVRNTGHDYQIYWKNNNYLKVKELIKNTSLFSDVEFFPSTLLQDIKFLKNCGEYHYVTDGYPKNKYMYSPLTIEPGRNIKVFGPRLSPNYFDMEYLYSLYNDNKILQEIRNMFKGFNLMDTAAVYINRYTKKEDLYKFMSLYKNNVRYLLVTDDFEYGANFVSDVYTRYYKEIKSEVDISWAVTPHPVLNHDIVKLYTFAICRVCFVNLSDPIVYMGTLLNHCDYADIIYAMDEDLIFNLLVPDNDNRYKNLKNL